MSEQNNKTSNTEYTHALTEAQTRLKALTTSFALFIDEDYEPDILGYQCVIDDADRLAGTVRHLYHLAKNAKAAQQPEPTQAAQSTQNQTDQAEDRGGFQNEDLHQAFAELAYSYGMLGRNISSERNNEALENIVIDCETLSNVSLAMRLQAKGGVK